MTVPTGPMCRCAHGEQREPSFLGAAELAPLKHLFASCTEARTPASCRAAPHRPVAQARDHLPGLVPILLPASFSLSTVTSSRPHVLTSSRPSGAGVKRALLAPIDRTSLTDQLLREPHALGHPNSLTDGSWLGGRSGRYTHRIAGKVILGPDAPRKLPRHDVGVERWGPTDRDPVRALSECSLWRNSWGSTGGRVLPVVQPSGNLVMFVLPAAGSVGLTQP